MNTNPAATAQAKVQSIIENNPFIQLLAQLANGRKATECAEEMANVIRAVKLTGKKGELVLKLTVKPDGKGEVQSVEIDGDVKPKKPKRDERATTFFVGEDCSLSRSDPNQAEIQFPELPAARAAGAR